MSAGLRLWFINSIYFYYSDGRQIDSDGRHYYSDGRRQWICLLAVGIFGFLSYTQYGKYQNDIDPDQILNQRVKTKMTKEKMDETSTGPSSKIQTTKQSITEPPELKEPTLATNPLECHLNDTGYQDYKTPFTR